MNEEVNINDILSEAMREREVPMGHDAARAGLVLGVGQGLVCLAEGAFAGSLIAGFMLNTLSWIIFAVLLQLALRGRVLKRGKPMLGLGESWLYLMLISFFAGIIVGLARYVVFRFIAYDYFSETYEYILDTVQQTQKLPADVLSVMDGVWHAPWVWFVGGIVNTLFTGAFIGLIVAAIGRRNPLARV